MFTGIVEETGTVKQIRRGVASAVLTVAADRVLTDVALGDSIAVNGDGVLAKRIQRRCDARDARQIIAGSSESREHGESRASDEG